VSLSCRRFLLMLLFITYVRVCALQNMGVDCGDVGLDYFVLVRRRRRCFALSCTSCSIVYAQSDILI
jgi:hypothetical protein